MAFQTRDVLDAMQRDAGAEAGPPQGGRRGRRQQRCCCSSRPTCSAWPSGVRSCAETTALGAAYLAGLAVGYWKDTDDVARNWALDREFTPAMPASTRDGLYGRWQKAVARSRDWEEHAG